MSKHMEEIRKAYYDPSIGFVGINKLHQKLKDKGISRGEIKYFLERQAIHQVTEKNNKKLPSFIPTHPLQEFQMDLIHFRLGSQAKYGLSVIDVFTKKAQIELLKKKDTNSILDAIVNVFEKMGTPEIVFADEGSEFISAGFRNLMKKLNVKLIITFSHAPFVERFNRTIKEMVEKYLESTKEKDITPIIHKVVENYNNSYHSVIGMSPNEVTDDNAHIVQKNIIKHSFMGKRKSLKVGDQVRVKLKDAKLKKGYKTKYSEKVFTIEKIEKPYYYVEGQDKPYLAAHLKLVKGEQANPNKVERSVKKGRTKARAVEVEIPELNVNERETRKKKPKIYKDFITY